MPKIELTDTLSTGNLLTIVALIAAGASAYAVTQTTVNVLQDRIVHLEGRVDELENAASERDVFIAETLTALRADVRYLRMSVEQLTGRQQ